ncbi:hypothetical protein ACTFIV_001002 [Dictyostelium citrinum]
MSHAHIDIQLPGFISTGENIHIHVGSGEEGFDCEAGGLGSFTGLHYSIPAHSKGTINTKIQVMAMSSDDIEHMNHLIESMLSASKKEEIIQKTKTSASANLSYWFFFTDDGGSGSGSASYEDTRNSMKSSGLTDEQISTIINELFKLAENMNHVELNLTCDNTAFNHAVSGSLYLYTIAGTVKTSKGTKQYRMLADQGTAGSPDKDNSPPVKGKIIPLK